MRDAKTLTASLGGHWYRNYGTASCPVCQPDRRKDQNALTLRDGSEGRLLAHCKRLGCDFRDVLRAAGIAPGDYRPVDAAELARREAEKRSAIERRAQQAKLLWRETQPIHGTTAETYLRGRGINCALPQTLRFHQDCWHRVTAKRHPALIALVEGGDGLAVHRTYLRPDGRGKADIETNKAMLGPISGGAVRLGKGQGPLVVAEGIETALSLFSGLLRTPSTIWAALSTSGIRGLRLPSDPGRLTIASDGDPAGQAAAQALAERADGFGWAVSLLPAPDGRDWNDVLIMKGDAA